MPFFLTLDLTYFLGFFLNFIRFIYMPVERGYADGKFLNLDLKIPSDFESQTKTDLTILKLN